MRVLNQAASKAANKTEVGGGATQESKSVWQIEKGGNRWRVASSTSFRLIVGLSIVLAPISGRANHDDKETRPGHEDNEKGIRGEIAALQSQMIFLRSTVSGLQGQVRSLQNSNLSLQNQLIAAHNVLALAPFVTVDPNPSIGVIGPNIIFCGANIHIRSGSGSTDDGGTPRGLGNLIIGYDEDPQTFVDGSPGGALPRAALNPGDRGGSHNLVIGAANRFTQAAFGGLVAGTANTIEGYGTSATAGAGNVAGGYGASASGGFSNTANGPFASVSGGRFNAAFQFYTSVSGGDSNTAGGTCSATCGLGASVSGGQGNTANGNFASVTGGTNNTASDFFTAVTGGTNNTAGSNLVFQGGLAASVVGGTGNTAGGRNTVVIGGQNVTDNKDNSIAPQTPFP